jgi:hypothetical protein
MSYLHNKRITYYPTIIHLNHVCVTLGHMQLDEN